MAENIHTVGVEFKASTSAAITAVKGMAGALGEATTAATVAGSAQEQLGKDVAITRRAQLEATEAVRAAKQALENLTLTERAFGQGSVQAAAAAEKLAAAEREAQRAAAAAAEALGKMAKEVEAAAVAEDGKLSPATKRAAAQVEKMGQAAQKTASDLHRVELDARRTSGGLDVMGLASGKLMAVLGPAALGGTLISVAGWLGETAEKTLQYETAVANLPFTISAARQATRGLISDQALVAGAANAAALGVAKTSSEFAGLAQATLKLAKPGQDVNALLNEITGALGRGSSESLNNVNVILTQTQAQERYAHALGKSTSALTDTEKAEAFKVEGLKAVIKAAEETTFAFDSNAAAIVRYKVGVGDAWDELTRGAANAAGSILTLTQSASGDIERLTKAAKDQAAALNTAWSPAFTAGAGELGKWSAEVLLGAQSVAHLQSVLGDTSALETFRAANDLEREKRDILSEEAEFSERAAKALESAAKANESFLEAQALHAMTMGPEEAPKRKRGGKAKKAEEFSSNSQGNAIVRGYDGREDTEAIAGMAVSAAAEGAALAAEERAAGIDAAEQALFDKQMQRFEEEAAHMDAAGAQESARVDMIMFSLEIESDAEVRRAEMMDQRLRREEDFARGQLRRARTDTQREQAQTRLEDAEHRKRIMIVTQAAEQERKVLERRKAIIEGVSGQVVSVGNAMVDGVQALVNGQRGALARGFADWTQDLAKRMGLKALEETVLAIAAAASYRYPEAAAHGVAAATALSVAAAAGGASYGLGKVASGEEKKQAAAEERKDAAEKAEKSGRGGSKRDSGSELERMEVPISYADRMPIAGATGPNITINIGTFVGGKDQAKALAEQVQRAVATGKGQGTRP